MSSLSFPDVNVWLALMLADHVHRRLALRWWDTDEAETIGFCRLTQLGVMRVLTTPAAMNGRPLTMNAAWKAHDRLYQDPRVVFLPEPDAIEEPLRRFARGGVASPKLWADGYLAAFATRRAATLVTFDRALASRSDDSLLLK
jgi:toxin-antitoxin system PIN domain toxin